LERAMEKSRLRATAAALEAWLKEVMPPRKIEPLPRDGDEITFESTPPPPGTQKLSVPSSTFQVPGSKDRVRVRVRVRIVLATLAVLIGIATAVLILWSPWKTEDPPRPPAVLPPPVVEEPQVAEDAGVAVDEAPPEKVVRKPKGKGILVLNSEPWARVLVDGKDTGVTTPTVGGLWLAVGRHKITLVNPELEISKTIVIVVKKGETVKRFVDLQREGVQH
jgi:hypothetical protein